MEKNIALVRMSLALGVITLFALAFSALALMDIGKGTEPDLSGEWTLVRLSYLFSFMFISMSMVTLWRISKESSMKMNQ